MTNRPPWKLANLTYQDVLDNDYEVAVIPFGATEPHNLHMPYATDTYESDVIGDAICKKAHELGGKVILLPTIPYGTETNQRECKLSMNLNPSTVYQIVTDMVESLVHHGIKKIMILNSHGGNEFKPHLRELQGKIDAHIFLCDWFRMVGDVYYEIFEHKEDHAGEMETSVMLAHFPELVEKDKDGNLRADEGATRPLRFEALNKKWVSISRRWDLLTTNTGSGNPHQASAEKGRNVTDLVVERVAPFLKELSDAEIDENFPFENP